MRAVIVVRLNVSISNRELKHADIHIVRTFLISYAHLK